jgi:hypothetical protein
MALMFQRLARNFAKNGYYPTDSETTQRVLNALVPANGARMRIFDPCAGEGVALAECKHHLDAERTLAFGVEYDAERAWHAKQVLDCCIHGDFQDCLVGQRQFGLLWLNPPYGDLVSDRADTGDRGGNKGRKRLEKLFYQLAVPKLQLGGVMVLIVPRYSLDAELSSWIARQFDRVRIYTASEQQFKQIVVVGIRKRTGAANVIDASESIVRKQLEAVAGDTVLDELPREWRDEVYVLPNEPQGEPVFRYARMEPEQLAVEINRHRCLWDQFKLKFDRFSSPHRRPLRTPSNWHLALLLAAGQVSGVVTSNDGRRTLVIKGDTFKDKQRKTQLQEQENGSFSETVILTDRFTPVIRALDFTPGSGYGRVVTIR